MEEKKDGVGVGRSSTVDLCPAVRLGDRHPNCLVTCTLVAN